jgi:hypothetical protein
MNIREVIDQLTAVAGRMPAAYDTEVRVAMCDGANVEITRALEIDDMALLDNEMRTVKEQFVIIKAHPHLDETSTVARGIAEDADDQLRRWTEDGEQ